MEDTLLAEVAHYQRRLDSALEQLRAWRLSNGVDVNAPATHQESVYESRPAISFGRDDDEDDDDLPGDPRQWTVTTIKY